MYTVCILLLKGRGAAVKQIQHGGHRRGCNFQLTLMGLERTLSIKFTGAYRNQKLTPKINKKTSTSEVISSCFQLTWVSMEKVKREYYDGVLGPHFKKNLFLKLITRLKSLLNVMRINYENKVLNIISVSRTV